MWRPLEDGQTPRPLQENATTNPLRHVMQTGWAKPKQTSPHSRWPRTSEIERTLITALITASGVTAAADTPSASRPRLGAVSFLHRFGSALNHRVHLHGYVTDGVFVPAAAASTGDAHGSEGFCNAKQQPRSHDTSRIAWAKLMARVGEEFPRACPACGGDIRLIAFITEPGVIREILTVSRKIVADVPLTRLSRYPSCRRMERMQSRANRNCAESDPVTKRTRLGIGELHDVEDGSSREGRVGPVTRKKLPGTFLLFAAANRVQPTRKHTMRSAVSSPDFACPMSTQPNPSPPPGPIEKAAQAWRDRRLGDAEQLCTAFLARESRHWPTYPLLTRVLLAQGRLAEADRLTGHVLAQVPAQPELLVARALVLDEAGRAAEALDLLDRAVDLRLTWREAADELDGLLGRRADPSPRYPVTVVTPTVGTRHVRRAIESVEAQTYPLARHLVVVDGAEHRALVEDVLPASPRRPIDVIVLPATIGGRGFNGHRVYAAAPYLVDSRFVAFLDEDNWLDPDHLEAVMAGITAAGAAWGFSLRRIVDEEGRFLADDDCESLGPVPSWLDASVHLVDANCYVLRRDLALATAGLWYRRAPDETSPDIELCRWLLAERPRFVATGRPTVNYRLHGPRAGVRADFFRRGNAEMLRRHGGRLPWRAEQPPEFNSRTW